MDDELVLAGSVLGRLADFLTDAEKHYVYLIAMYLRARKQSLTVERQDMALYSQAAGAVYALAKHLSLTQTRFPRKTMDDWLEIVVGKRFNFVAPSEEAQAGKEVIDAEISETGKEKIQDASDRNHDPAVDHQLPSPADGSVAGRGKPS